MALLELTFENSGLIIMQVVDLLGSNVIHLQATCAQKNFFFLTHGVLYVGESGIVFATKSEQTFVRYVDVLSVEVSNGQGLAMLDGIGVYLTTTYGTRYHFTEMPLTLASDMASFVIAKTKNVN